MAGESCALVTDAGTPAISDPGELLVAELRRRRIFPWWPIPGPCALVTALAASGQPTGRFTFEGFLAMNKKNRRAHLESLRGGGADHDLLRGPPQARLPPSGDLAGHLLAGSGRYLCAGS